MAVDRETFLSCSSEGGSRPDRISCECPQVKCQYLKPQRNCEHFDPEVHFVTNLLSILVTHSPKESCLLYARGMI